MTRLHLHLIGFATAFAATVSAHAKAWQERGDAHGIKLEAHAVPAERFANN